MQVDNSISSLENLIGLLNEALADEDFVLVSGDVDVGEPEAVSHLPAVVAEVNSLANTVIKIINDAELDKASQKLKRPIDFYYTRLSLQDLWSENKGDSFVIAVSELETKTDEELKELVLNTISVDPQFLDIEITTDENNRKTAIVNPDDGSANYVYIDGLVVKFSEI